MNAFVMLNISVEPTGVSLSVNRLPGLSAAVAEELMRAEMLYAGNQLAPVRQAILDVVQELAGKQGLLARPSGGGFGDVMKQSDGVGVSLACGHPNTPPGEICPNCGQQAAGLGPH